MPPRSALPVALAAACALAAPAAAEPDDDPAATPPLVEARVEPLPLPHPTSRLPLGGDAPPVQWQEFDVEGELLEPAATVRAFLEPEMRLRRGALTRQAREEITEYLRANLGYHLVAAEMRRLPTGGPPLLVLVLEPQTVVRRVAADTGNSFIDRLRGLSGRGMVDAVYSEEIVRRMRLRTGSGLARDRQERDQQLEEEAERIADYLRNEGYFEVEVDIRDRPSGPHSVVLHVDVTPGPRYRVGKIQVTGNTAVATSEIVRQFRHARLCLLEGILGDLGCYGERPFSRQQLNSDIQKVVELYQRRGYPGVRVRTDFDLRHSFKRDSKTVEFMVTVQERRKIDVVFLAEDGRDLPEERLRDILTFSEEGSYDEVEVRASAEAIRRHFQSQGHFEANVTWERLRFGFFDRIVYTIAAGPKLKIRGIEFEGNAAVSDERLAGAVTTEVFRSLAVFGTRGGYVTSLQLQQDVERLERLYRNAGYPEARIRVRVTRDARLADSIAALAATVAAELPSSDLYVHFVIDEGPRHTVEDVRFEFESESHGGEHTDRSRLLRQIKLRPGHPYFEGRAERELDTLRQYYFQKGYPHAEVQVETRPGAEPHQTVVIYKISESHEVRFGKVILRGNFRTRDWVILDELDYEEGEPLTLTRAERGQQNLRTAGLFNTVQVNLVKFDDHDQEDINVVVQVEERHPGLGDLHLAGGYSTDTGVFGEGGLQFPNLLGMGLRSDGRVTVGLKNAADPSRDNLQFLLEGKLAAPRWIARRYIGLGVRGEASGFLRREVTPRFGQLDSKGASVGLSRSGLHGFFEGWLLSLRYDYRQRNREENLIRPPGASDDLAKSPVTTSISAPVLQLIIDKRRDGQGRLNPLTPVSGFKLDFRALYAEERLLGSDSFVKLGAGGQHFWKPSVRLLVSHAVRYDHGVPLPLGRALLPEVERFFAGGDTTVRGFEEDRLATEIIREPVPPLGDTTRIRVLPAGGNIRFIHNIDLQLNVWELLGYPVASAIFFDTGLVTNSLDGFELGDLRHSVGAALFRWLSPVGAISVEWAIPLDPHPGDDPRGRLHFNIGLMLP